MKAYLFPSIHLLLLAVAGYFAVGLFYRVTTADLVLSPPPPPARDAVAAPRAVVSRPLGSFGVIAERNLFHTADSTEAQTAAKDVDLAALQETKLDLKLWGTLVMDRNGLSYAVIEDKKAGGQNLYQSGDTVQQATVKMILRERVVLDVDGHDEILQIEQPAAIAGPGSPPAPAAPAPEAAAAVTPPPSEPVAKEVTVNREAIQNAMGNLAELMKQVRIQPFLEDGKPAGLRMAGIAPKSIFAQMGIRNNDVIRSVDGRQIQSVDDIIGFYQGLGEAEKLTLQVLRGGRTEDIRYSIE